jgi:hypothetical protein
MGAVLVGSHAFGAYSPLLGVAWLDSFKTHDVDIAQDNHLAIALAPNSTGIDMSNVLARLNMGFHPIPAFNHDDPSTSFKIRGKEFILDFLTPQCGRVNERPVFLPTLGTAAQPLRFLDYLITDPIQAVLAYDHGILVNLPRPVRYALHKIVISRRRGDTAKAKQKKDLAQAQLLLEVLAKTDSHAIEAELKALKSYHEASFKVARRFVDDVLG